MKPTVKKDKKTLKDEKKPPVRSLKRPAALNALDFFFKPKSIAVVGASIQEGKIGHVLLTSLMRSFRGTIYPVNSHETEMYGIKCYPNLKSIPGNVDLAVIAVPAESAIATFREAGQKKVGGVIMVSAGFAESGNEKLQKELEKAIAAHPQTKLLGPNCLGLLDLQSGVDALFLPPNRLERPALGGLGFVSQSGALGGALLDWCALNGTGISKFISIGNATQLTETDWLQYLSFDPQTKVIAMYLEGVKNGKRFLEVLTETTQRKPVVILKGGQTKGGKGAAKSHTAALSGQSEVFEAAVKQGGGILADDLHELFEYAKALEHEPRLDSQKSVRVQIITNGGGYGILCADAVEKAGLELATPSEESKRQLKTHLPSFAPVDNPVDLLGDADDHRYEQAVKIMLEDESNSAILLVTLFELPRLSDQFSSKLIKMLEKRNKPVILLSVNGQATVEKRKELEKNHLSVLQEPKHAVKTILALQQYALWLNKNRLAE